MVFYSIEGETREKVRKPGLLGLLGIKENRVRKIPLGQINEGIERLEILDPYGDFVARASLLNEGILRVGLTRAGMVIVAKNGEETSVEVLKTNAELVTIRPDSNGWPRVHLHRAEETNR